MIEEIRDTAVTGDSLRADQPRGGDDRGVGRAPDAVARSDAAIVLDARGRVATVTPSARCILGVRSADLMGSAIGQLAVPEDRLRLARWLTAHQGSADRQGCTDLPPIAFRVARRHDRHADAVARSLGLGTESESPRVLVELSVGAEPPPQDRRSQVVELQERVNQLERTNRQLEVSACTAAHDLQAPLASVAASIELLVRQAGAVLDETSQEIVSDVLRSVGQMSRLVDGLLRSSQAGVRLQVELADGDALISDVMRELQPDLDAAEGIVTVAPLGPVIADVQQMRSVFVNLLANAIRYRSMARPLRVWIDVHDGPLERTFIVSDNGPGIPVPDRDRVFTMFERIDSRTPGSGIGLAICQRIIEAHGGRIWLDDGSDGGLAVHFTLPAQNLLGN